MAFSTYKATELIKANVHFGHKTMFLNPKMNSQILGIRNDICVINLEKTIQNLNISAKIIEHVILNKGHILFIGTNPLFKNILHKFSVKLKSLTFIKNQFNFITKNNSFTVSLTRLNKITKHTQLAIILNPKENSHYIKELNKVNIPVMAIVDTTMNPKGIDYIIPGNDDAIQAIHMYCNIFFNIIKATDLKFKNSFLKEIKKSIINIVTKIYENKQ